MKNFWLTSGLGTKMALIYLIISLILFGLFFTGICTIFLLFGAGLCLVTSFPWSYILPAYLTGDANLYDSLYSYLIGGISGVIINALIIFLVGYISEKLFKKYGLQKLSVVFFIIVLGVAGYYITVQRVTGPQSCTSVYNPDGCYFDVATERNDISLCDKIIDKGSLGRCQGTIVAQSGDPSKCSVLTSKEAISMCYSEMAGKNKDQSLCNNIPIEKDSEYCKFNNLSSKNNPTYCKSFSSEDWQNQCYHRLTWILKDVSLCSFITSKDPDQKGDCYKAMAQETKDYSLCALANPNDKESCYLNIARDTKNELICPLINDPTNKSRCFYSVAVQTGKSNLCDKVIGDKYKKDCYDGAKLQKLMQGN